MNVIDFKVSLNKIRNFMIEEQNTPSIEDFFSNENTPITTEAPSDLLVIPDVHGDLDAFNRSLDIGMNFFAKKSKTPEVILLGDIIDRGLDSVSIIKRIGDLTNQNINSVILIGNHEAMFIECLYNPNAYLFAQWMYNGGLQTLHSFAYLFEEKIREFIFNLYHSCESESFADLYHDCALNEDIFVEIASVLKSDPLVKHFIMNLDLCVQRSTDLFVHAGFLPNFIGSEENLEKWVFAMQTSFKQSLLNKLNGNQNDFANFLSASVSRGGQSIAGPLWADYSDFKLSQFDAALLTTLMNAQSVDRMVVGHNIVSEPHYVSVSPIPSRKLDVLFLDIGMSHHYNSSYSSMALCITEQGDEYIINNKNQLIRFI